MACCQVALSPRTLACKSWANRVPQYAPGVPPRKIFGGDLGPFAVVLGPLLHGCYMAGRGQGKMLANSLSRSAKERGQRGC